MLEKACAHFTFKICALPNPPSQNERLSKGYRIADINASALASHKTHACISLKQRGYSRNYGLVCNLGKPMADRQSAIIKIYNFLILHNNLPNSTLYIDLYR